MRSTSASASGARCGIVPSIAQAPGIGAVFNRMEDGLREKATSANGARGSRGVACRKAQISGNVF
jgi:hypothetical protein